MKKNANDSAETEEILKCLTSLLQVHHPTTWMCIVHITFTNLLSVLHVPPWYIATIEVCKSVHYQAEVHTFAVCERAFQNVCLCVCVCGGGGGEGGGGGGCACVCFFTSSNLFFCLIIFSLVNKHFQYYMVKNTKAYIVLSKSGIKIFLHKRHTGVVFCVDSWETSTTHILWRKLKISMFFFVFFLMAYIENGRKVRLTWVCWRKVFTVWMYIANSKTTHQTVCKYANWFLLLYLHWANTVASDQGLCCLLPIKQVLERSTRL